MRIAVVSAFYSEGMGYTENCLPKSLAALGHDVHLVTSKFNVYGTSSEYSQTYEAFLGPADQGVGTFETDGYTVHRLETKLIRGYVALKGLADKLREIGPEIVHCTEIASLPAMVLAAIRPIRGFRLFAESHQHVSVLKPFLRTEGGAIGKRIVYRLTRTLPTFLTSLAVERCYAIAPDCLYVANRFYGVPQTKLKLQSLGTDTSLFRPAQCAEEKRRRSALRAEFGYTDADIVSIYTGRLTPEKNPLLLARAVERIAERDARFKSLFVGAGSQSVAIAECQHAKVLPFMKHAELADLYRSADIAVWPRQESMSMLDAAACGLPLVVSDRIGDNDRIAGNGAAYSEGDSEDLARVLAALSSPNERRALGERGRAKMVSDFSWKAIAESVAADYAAVVRAA
jgi:glycosyltransferase involved in cell wall biosynthesis